jgi:hypothetical protein
VTDIPEDVLDWIRSVFTECNVRVTDKLGRNPNAPEESFDLSWIEHVGRYASPTILDSKWAVKIESHYLGGLRHFRNWEIADIGVLVFLRMGPDERKSKVALLQSKRLYPSGIPIRDETRSDFEIGLARLADPEDDALSIGLDTEFTFGVESRYEAMQRESEQMLAISAYETNQKLHVYYQFYNPWSIPFSQRVPLAGYSTPDGVPPLGVRVVPAHAVHLMLRSTATRVPTLGHLDAIGDLPQYGWRLEEFICDELLLCREGDEFASISDDRIQSLFYRRSGPIAAAIAITIEAPDSVRAP